MIRHAHLKSFSEVANQIQEADILLFRGSGLFSRFIKIAGGNEYSHVGIASWKFSQNEKGIFVPDILECIEFREWKGGRTTSLEEQVIQNPGQIDVYRPARKIQKFSIDNLGGSWTDLNPIKVTSTMRKMTGLPYGWGRIVKIARTKLFGTRLIFLTDTDDDEIADTYPVCSTAVARAFKVGFIDLFHNLSDNSVEPSHFAICPAFSYLFTLTT